MKFAPSLRKGFITLMALLLLVGNSFLTYATETNFWKDRQERRPSLTPNSELTLSQITPRPAPPNNMVLPQTLPGFSPSHPSAETNFAPDERILGFPRLLPRLIETGNRYGHLNISVPTTSRPTSVLLLIQDVHRNQEAQTNISALIQDMARQTMVSFVAMEGAFGPIDLQPFHDFEDQAAIRESADFLLAKKELTGPLHAGLLGQFPTPPLVGVDDPGLYENNVEACREASALQNVYKTRLSEKALTLEKEKSTVLNERLKLFDQEVGRYRRKGISFGEYLSILCDYPLAVPQTIATFQQALQLEKNLDFDAVRKERDELLGHLTVRLNKADQTTLLQASLAYRMGKLSHFRFYELFQGLAAKSRLPLKNYVHLQNYLKYNMLAEKIDARDIVAAAKTREDLVYQSLTISPQERELIILSRKLDLADKLLSLALSSEEWSMARHELADFQWETIPQQAQPPKAVESSSTPDLTAFINFYEMASQRDQTMADKILGLIRSNETQAGILVAGGFHAAGVEERLKQEGVIILTFVPRLTKIDHEGETAYLSVFNQEKTPLEKMVEGEKLFLTQKVWPPALRLHLASLACIQSIWKKREPPSNSHVRADINRMSGFASKKVSWKWSKSSVLLTLNGILLLHLVLNPQTGQFIGEHLSWLTSSYLIPIAPQNFIQIMASPLILGLSSMSAWLVLVGCCVVILRLGVLKPGVSNPDWAVRLRAFLTFKLVPFMSRATVILTGLTVAMRTQSGFSAEGDAPASESTPDPAPYIIGAVVVGLLLYIITGLLRNLVLKLGMWFQLKKLIREARTESPNRTPDYPAYRRLLLDQYTTKGLQKTAAPQKKGKKKKEKRQKQPSPKKDNPSDSWVGGKLARADYRLKSGWLDRWISREKYKDAKRAYQNTGVWPDDVKQPLLWRAKAGAVATAVFLWTRMMVPIWGLFVFLLTFTFIRIPVFCGRWLFSIGSGIGRFAARSWSFLSAELSVAVWRIFTRRSADLGRLVRDWVWKPLWGSVVFTVFVTALVLVMGLVLCCLLVLSFFSRIVRFAAGFHPRRWTGLQIRHTQRRLHLAAGRWQAWSDQTKVKLKVWTTRQRDQIISRAQYYFRRSKDAVLQLYSRLTEANRSPPAGPRKPYQPRPHPARADVAKARRFFTWKKSPPPLSNIPENPEHMGDLTLHADRDTLIRGLARTEAQAEAVLNNPTLEWELAKLDILFGAGDVYGMKEEDTPATQATRDSSRRLWRRTNFILVDERTTAAGHKERSYFVSGHYVDHLIARSSGLRGIYLKCKVLLAILISSLLSDLLPEPSPRRLASKPSPHPKSRAKVAQLRRLFPPKKQVFPETGIPVGLEDACLMALDHETSPDRDSLIRSLASSPEQAEEILNNPYLEWRLVELDSLFDSHAVYPVLTPTAPGAAETQPSTAQIWRQHGFVLTEMSAENTEQTHYVSSGYLTDLIASTRGLRGFWLKCQVLMASLAAPLWEELRPIFPGQKITLKHSPQQSALAGFITMLIGFTGIILNLTTSSGWSLYVSLWLTAAGVWFSVHALSLSNALRSKSKDHPVWANYWYALTRNSRQAGSPEEGVLPKWRQRLKPQDAFHTEFHEALHRILRITELPKDANTWSLIWRESLIYAAQIVILPFLAFIPLIICLGQLALRCKVPLFFNYGMTRISIFLLGHGMKPNRFTRYWVPDPPIIQFFGGSGEVGGSANLIAIGGKTGLVDAGLDPSQTERKPRKTGVSKKPHRIPLMYSHLKSPPDFIFITHAHMDHIGYLPILFHKFTGQDIPVYASAATIDLMKVILDDTQQLLAKHRIDYPFLTDDEMPTKDDFSRVFQNLRPIPENEPLLIGRQTWVRAVPAGHILGACSFEFVSLTGKVTISGDLCLHPQRLVEPAQIPTSRPDILVMEGTYGDRDTITWEDEANRMLGLIDETIQNGGSVVTASLAMGRGQEVLSLLRDAQDEGRLAGALHDVKIYFDGLIKKINAVYEKYAAHPSPGGLFEGEEATIKPVKDQKQRAHLISRLREEHGRIIIVAPSGMLTGGHSLAYVSAALENPDNLILLVSYQGTGTPGRKLLNLNQGDTIRLDGGDVIVRARVEQIHLTAHAGKADLISYSQQANPRELYLVHGNRSALMNLAQDPEWSASPEAPKFPRTVPQNGSTWTMTRPTTVDTLKRWSELPLARATRRLKARSGRKPVVSQPTPPTQPAPKPKAKSKPKPGDLNPGDVVLIRHKGSVFPVLVTAKRSSGNPPQAVNVFRFTLGQNINTLSINSSNLVDTIGSSQGLLELVNQNRPDVLAYYYELAQRCTPARTRMVWATLASLLQGSSDPTQPLSLTDMAGLLIADDQLHLQMEKVESHAQTDKPFKVFINDPLAGDIDGQKERHNLAAACIKADPTLFVALGLARHLQNGSETYFRKDQQTGQYLVEPLEALHKKGNPHVEELLRGYSIPLGSPVVIHGVEKWKGPNNESTSIEDGQTGILLHRYDNFATVRIVSVERAVDIQGPVLTLEKGEDVTPDRSSQHRILLAPLIQSPIFLLLTPVIKLLMSIHQGHIIMAVIIALSISLTVWLVSHRYVFLWKNNTIQRSSLLSSKGTLGYLLLVWAGFASLYLLVHITPLTGLWYALGLIGASIIPHLIHNLTWLFNVGIRSLLTKLGIPAATNAGTGESLLPEILRHTPLKTGLDGLDHPSGTGHAAEDLNPLTLTEALNQLNILSRQNVSSVKPIHVVYLDDLQRLGESDEKLISFALNTTNQLKSAQERVVFIARKNSIRNRLAQHHLPVLDVEAFIKTVGKDGSISLAELRGLLGGREGETMRLNLIIPVHLSLESTFLHDPRGDISVDRIGIYHLQRGLMILISGDINKMKQAQEVLRQA